MKNGFQFETSGEQSTIQSKFAAAMGAEIRLTKPGCDTYLVSGMDTSPESVVRAEGGDIVLRLGATRVLAAMPIASYLRLRSRRDIAAIGPVCIDLNRLAAFVKAAAQSNNVGST